MLRFHCKCRGHYKRSKSSVAKFALVSSQHNGNQLAPSVPIREKEKLLQSSIKKRISRYVSCLSLICVLFVFSVSIHCSTVLASTICFFSTCFLLFFVFVLGSRGLGCSFPSLEDIARPPAQPSSSGSLKLMKKKKPVGPSTN